MGRLRIAIAALTMLAALPARALPTPSAPGAAGVALASANVGFVATIPDPGMMDGRIIGDTLYATSATGLRIYDLGTLSGIPVLIGTLPIANFSNEDLDTNGRVALIANDYGPTVVHVIDVSNPTVPALTATLDMPTGSAHTATCIRGCSYAWIAGASRITVLDLRDPAKPSIAGTFPLPGGSHDVNEDEQGIAWVVGGGLWGYDTTDPVDPTLIVEEDPAARFENDFILHGSIRPNGGAVSGDGLRNASLERGELMLVVEEDWLGPFNSLCESDGAFQTGWYRVVDDRPVVQRLDTYHVGIRLDASAKPTGVTCSAHWFHHRDDGIVGIGWYDQGVRFLDVSQPSDIREVGYFVPGAAQTMSVRYHEPSDTWLTFDLVRGIDVLRLID